MVNDRPECKNGEACGYDFCMLDGCPDYVKATKSINFNNLGIVITEQDILDHKEKPSD